MVRVTWSKVAIDDLEAVRLYIAEFDPVAAENMVDRLRTAGNSLADFPRRGRPSGPFRELVPHRSYVIRYFTEGSDVLILAVRHAARRMVEE